MVKKSNGIKAQDILVLLKLLVSNLSQKEIADSVGLSQAEVSNAIKRLLQSQLIDSSGKVIKRSALEFLVYGLKYVFPAIQGPVARGVPTAHSHPNFKFVQYSSGEEVVWPNAEGEVLGHSISPLYGSVARIVKKDPQLYEYLSLIDMIRIGRAREVKLASDKLREKFGEA